MKIHALLKVVGGICLVLLLDSVITISSQNLGRKSSHLESISVMNDGSWESSNELQARSAKEEGHAAISSFLLFLISTPFIFLLVRSEFKTNPKSRQQNEYTGDAKIPLVIQRKLSIGHWELDRGRSLLKFSDYWYELSGLPYADYQSVHEFLQQITVEDRKRVELALNNLQSGAPFIDEEFHVETQKGKIVLLRLVGYLTIQQQKGLSIQGTYQVQRRSLDDINNLKLLAQQFSMAQKVGKFGIWKFNFKTKTVEWDRQMYAIYGQKEGTFQPTVRKWKSLVNAKDHEKLEQEFIKMSNGVVSKNNLQFSIKLPTGKRRVLRARSEMFMDSRGKVDFAIGVNWDVTEDLEKTETLDSNLELFNKAQKIANVGNFDYYIQEDRIQWSDQLNAMFGHPQNFDYTLSAWLKMIHPEDRQFSAEQVQRAISKNLPINFEHRIITADGEVKLLSNNARVHYDDEGHPYKIAGITNDLTNERGLQNRLTENLKLQTLLTRVSLKLNQVDRFSSAIDHALEMVGEALDIERIYIYKEDQDADEFIRKRCWQCGDVSKKGFNVPQHIPRSSFSNIKTTLKRKVMIEDAQQADKDERFVAQYFGSLAYLSFPLIIESQHLGFIMFDMVQRRKKWNELEIRYLESFMFIISNAINEKNTRDQLFMSKKKYKNFYHFTPAITLGVFGNILNASEFWLQKMGYKPSEVIGKRILDFITDDCRQTLREHLLEFKSLGYARNLKFEFIKKSKEKMDVLLSAVMEKGVEGEPDKIFAVITDITRESATEKKIIKLNNDLERKIERRTAVLKKLSEELIKQKNLLESVIHNTDSLIFIKDLNGKYLLANSPFLKAINWDTRNSIINRSDHEIFDADYAKHLKSLDNQIISSRSTLKGEEEIQGSDRTYLTTRFPLYNQRGEIYGICGLSTDITEIKEQRYQLTISNRILVEQQEQLKGGQKKLLEANQNLESFTYSVSHDLKAPLRSLEGFSKLLFDQYSETLEGNGLKWLNFIQQNAIKMNTLINDLLEFSRITRLTINKVEIDMTKMVQAILSEESVNYSTKHEIEINGLAKAVGDPHAIRQLWVNLISNAFKYSSKNDLIRIKIWSEETEENIRYSVSDNGAGFNQEYESKLFEVFQRLHNDRDFPGTGVGLAIVKKILDKHSGTISANNNECSGATFSFTLPKG